MRAHARRAGFTLVEMAVTIAIVAVVAALAYPSLSRMRPRATLADASADVVGLLYNARQNALATGHYTVVMVFPNQASAAGGNGRLVAFEDPRFTTATSTFNNWDATRTAGVTSSNLIGSVELPRGVSFGLGGSAAPSLPAPYDAVTGNASYFTCNFCRSNGDGRGAIMFDSRGRARFFATAAGGAQALVAGTLAITGSPDITGYRLFLISPSTGAVRPYGTG